MENRHGEMEGGGNSGPQQPIPHPQPVLMPPPPPSPHALPMDKEAPTAALKLQLVGVFPSHRGSDLGPTKAKQGTAPAVQHVGL